MFVAVWKDNKMDHSCSGAVFGLRSIDNAIQDAVNLIAIFGFFHRHLMALRQSGFSGNHLSNHPVSLVFVSTLNSLCRIRHMQ